MALSRTPTAITANGVSMLVKGAGVNNFIRVPGLANFTMPDETGSTTETQLLDGSVAAAQPAGVGSITGTIGAIGPHPSHQFLEARKQDQQQITVTVVKPAAEVTILEDSAAIAITYPAATANAPDGIVVIPGGGVSSMRESQLIAIAANAAGLQSPPKLVPWNKAFGDLVAADDDVSYHVIRSVDPDSGKIKVSPGFKTAKTSGNSIYSLRNAGLLYKDISCTVSGLGSGDFQSGGNASSSITLQPVSAVTRAIEHRTLAEIVAANSEDDYNGVFDNL